MQSLVLLKLSRRLNANVFCCHLELFAVLVTSDVAFFFLFFFFFGVPLRLRSSSDSVELFRMVPADDLETNFICENSFSSAAAIRGGPRFAPAAA